MLLVSPSLKKVKNQIKKDKIYNYLLQLAIRYISVKPRTKKQITDYLIKKSKKFKINLTQKINRVVLELVERDYINDDQFIKLWVEDRSYFKPRGTKLIVSELIKKGISKTKINNYFQNNPINESQLAQKLVNKKIIANKKTDKEKLFQLLLRRGFSFSVCKKTIEDLTKKE